MTKNLTLAIAVVFAAGAGFGLGLLAQRSIFDRPPASNTIFDHRRRDELLTAWKYPGAKLVKSADAGSQLYYGVFTTSDDINEVGKHYEKLLGMGVSAEGPGSGITGNEERAVASINDSATADGKPRCVQMALAAQRAKDYVVTLQISRTKEEHTTHIVLFIAQR